MRAALFRILALLILAVPGAVPTAADEMPVDDKMAEDITDSFAHLGKAITIPAYARGAASEVVSVEKMKLQHSTQPDSRPKRLRPGHREN